jgi:hypothetical protein
MFKNANASHANMANHHRDKLENNKIQRDTQCDLFLLEKRMIIHNQKVE